MNKILKAQIYKEKVRSQIIDLFFNEFLTTREIGKRFNRSHTWVWKIIKNHRECG